MGCDVVVYMMSFPHRESPIQNRVDRKVRIASPQPSRRVVDAHQRDQTKRCAMNTGLQDLAATRREDV